MAQMWETMKGHYQNQSKIVLDLRNVDISQSTNETSEHHHSRTVQLSNVVGDWHIQFGSLVDNQRKYIKALYNWLRLSLIPIESSLNERVSSPPRIQRPPIQKLLLAWQDSLGQLEDNLARTAIYNFRAVMDTLVDVQREELKQRVRCEETMKELSRKERSFEDWKRKLMDRRTPTDDMEVEDERHRITLVEKELALEMLRKRLEEELDACGTTCQQVRDKSLTSFKNRMPELFTALENFAARCSKMYYDLKSILQQ